VVSGHFQTFAEQVEDFPVVGSTEARSALGDCVEHRLEIFLGRSADDPQDFGRRRLLVQSLDQLAVARPELPQRVSQGTLLVAV
jgi:hypothetical protein